MAAVASPRRSLRLVHLTTTDMSLDWLLGPQLRAFAEAGYEVIGASAPGPHVEAIEAAGIRHVALRHATRAMDPRQDVAALVELRRLFDELAPDLVHTHNPKPGVYGRVAARLAGVPVVNTQHGLYATPEDRLARRAVVYGLERAAAACSDAELVQNEEDLELLSHLGVPRSRLVLLGNGIDLERFGPHLATPERRAAVRAELGIGPDEVVVGLVGRLVAEKGYREVFAAAALLARLAPSARVLIIGPTDEAKGDAIGPDELDAAMRDARIRFLGRRDDVERLYGAMDCYVLASHREGFPRSAMEAAAVGLPIVATDVRGCRQVVDDGATGLLVPRGDPVALAEAIAHLVADPARRATMGAAAAAKARKRFDVETVIRITLETYERVLAARGVRTPSGAG